MIDSITETFVISCCTSNTKYVLHLSVQLDFISDCLFQIMNHKMTMTAMLS